MLPRRAAQRLCWLVRRSHAVQPVVGSLADSGHPAPCHLLQLPSCSHASLHTAASAPRQQGERGAASRHSWSQLTFAGTSHLQHLVRQPDSMLLGLTVRAASSAAPAVSVRPQSAQGRAAGVLEGVELDSEDEWDGVVRTGAGSRSVDAGTSYSSSSSSSSSSSGGKAKRHGRDASGAGPSGSQQHQLGVESFMQAHNIKIEYGGEGSPPAPVLTMDQAPFSSSVMSSIHRSGFNDPTPVQSITWPVAMDRHNLIAIASTGSGKTAAYLLPALDMLHRGQLSSPAAAHPKPQMGRGSGRALQPAAVVLLPTRELAVQVGEQAQRFAAPLGIRSAVVYGGASKRAQMAELSRNRPLLLMATPGRLQDLVNEGAIDLSNVQYLTLDEADRMLDMGFEQEVNAIAGMMPRGDKRQTVLFSATWPREVRGLAAHILRGSRNPTVHLFVGNVQEELVASPSVHQDALVLQSRGQKLDALLEFIAELKAREEDLEADAGPRGSSRTPHPRILVFANTKDECERLAWMLRDEPGLPPVCVIHGDKVQAERERAFSLFKSGRAPILVATDVAARGLDIPNVKGVVNWDAVSANRPQDYVHRIGRTGRAGASGHALSLLVRSTAGDVRFAPQLAKIMVQAGQTVPEEVKALVSSRGGGGGGGFSGSHMGRGGKYGSPGSHVGRGGHYGTSGSGGSFKKFDNRSWGGRSDAHVPYHKRPRW